MSTEYQVESRLRPPQELWGAFHAGLLALVFLGLPELFVVVPSFCYAIALAFALIALNRARQGWELVAYQKGLWRSVRFIVSHRKMPYSKKRTYLGRGFEWTRVHAQRLYDLDRAPARYREPPRRNTIARRFEDRVEGTWLDFLARATSSPSRWNPLAPSVTAKGKPCVHGVGQPEGEQDVFQDTRARNTHTITFGGSGSGKTRLVDVVSSQDVVNDDVVIVIDPKGDTELLRNLYAAAEKAGRVDNFSAIHLGFPDQSIGYNLLGNWARVTEPATLLAGLLPAEGQSLAFKEFSWRFVNIIIRAMVALGRQSDVIALAQHTRNIDQLAVDYLEAYLESIDHREGAWRHDVEMHIQNQTEQRGGGRFRAPEPTPVVRRANALRHYYRSHNIEDSLALSLLQILDQERTHLEKLVGSLQPLLEKLTSGDVGNLLSPRPTVENPIPVLQWAEHIRTNGIVYIGLDAMSDSEVSHAAGSAMLAGLGSALGQIYKHGVTGADGSTFDGPRIMLHIDEATEVISSSALIQLANKGRGANLHMNLYTQTLSDLEVALASEPKAMQVIGNISNRIIMSVQDPKTAELITKSLQRVDIDYMMVLSGHTDSSDPDSAEDFGTRTEQRTQKLERDALHASDLMKLPEGQAFAVINGGELWKVRVPLADPADAKHLPTRPVDLVRLANRPHFQDPASSAISRARRGAALDDPASWAPQAPAPAFLGEIEPARPDDEHAPPAVLPSASSAAASKAHASEEVA